ncbi:MetQ/NlpA family ABC transporter substrate-binding protein [Oleispirillum naphthae]|uniref:MetQ/NlpA family ABC transporter substrate-binding protein n=1 Tax=Oleispirillum naphthae TaxID=2838853 RepID=UPI003082238B
MNRFAIALAGALLALPALAPADAAARTYTVGVTPGTHERTMEFVKPLLAKKGIDIKIVSFSDYVLPNQAVDSGDLDMNAFQHQPYLDNQVKDRGYKLVSVGTNFVEPMGVYSTKIKSLAELKAGDRVAIPNDPTNGGRALLLLQKRGLIKLAPGAALTAGVVDIAGNPKKLRFVELDAAQLPRSLPDVTIAAINTNYALEANLVPTRDALAIEAADSPYANIFVVHARNKDAAWVKAIVSTYQTAPVRDFILKTFKGAVAPAF